ncbi:putative RDD family membrane protein YckC [Friedmanniella endophytica]|uniref:Putative RDD family membrane protein YckC n=1 Tax=Microlunatus kandeliicorticis TaxID=1759536 RepID=A0A7W3P5Z9_9ACTN|nr:RDD family protein [Microlunatus kandeliicorticis]MBA8794427.1 putative RDD family membrane protein YckC [Microlunatus kandeliicorticis]
MSRADRQDRADDRWVEHPEPRYPGERLGLPETGRTSLASWKSRIGALVLDWALSMLIAIAIFSPAVLTETDWRRFMTLAVFFVESALLSATAGGSFGQLLLRIAVMRLDGRPLGVPRAIARAALVSLALPPLIVDGNRRGLQDMICGTVVVNRR